MYFGHNPNKALIEKKHLRQFQKQLEASSERNEHFLIMGDFNADVSDSSTTSFCTLFKLRSTVKEPTCCKNPENSSCIRLFLTNCPKSFLNTCLYYGKCEKLGNMHIFRLLSIILKIGLFIMDFE